MSAENPSFVSRPQILVGRLLSDPTALSDLLDPGRPVARSILFLKCQKELKEFNPAESNMFVNLLLAGITNVPDERVKKGALVLFKIPEVTKVPPQLLTRALENAIQRLVDKDGATKLEQDLIEEALQGAFLASLPFFERDRLLLKLKKIKVTTPPKQGERKVSEISSFRRRTKRREEVLSAYDEDELAEELEGQDGVKTSIVEDITVRSGRKHPDRERHLHAVSESPREIRMRKIEVLRDQCVGLTPDQIEAKVAELRNEGYFKNFEIGKILGLSESGLGYIIQRLINDRKIESRGRK